MTYFVYTECMHRITLPKTERDILIGYLQTAPIALMRLKSQSILMRSESLQEEQIARLLGRSARTIRRWVGDFSERRLASIFSGHQDNENASKLTRKQKEEISNVLKNPPSEYDLPREFWDVPSLRDYIAAEFGVVYESRQSYHFLLKFSGLSFKQPAVYDIRRDEANIQKRMEEILEGLEPYMRDSGWEVFVSDETRIMYEAITRRAWLKKGGKTVLKVERSRKSQNYIGFLSQKDFSCSLYRLRWQNQKEILGALRSLLSKYPDKRVCIVWDNASFHRGKLIREALGRGHLLERVHLINLPPYAPDMNPIEHVWGTVKDLISNVQFKSFEATKRKFEQLVRRQNFEYKIGHFVLS